MKPERWRQIEDVLQAAIDCPEPERASFLDVTCAGDDELKRETTSLLRAFADAGEFMEQPAIERDARVLAKSTPNTYIGRLVGSYKIVERLGAGGMGEVYLAKDERLGRLVALKILPAYFVFAQNRLSRFQREARAVSALNHPNILTIHEVGEFDELHFIATEFIDGQTLREVYEERSISIKEILDIAAQIAAALTVAHAAGIVHRDIKPENIMLRTDGIVKILDFGIAKLTEQNESESSNAVSASFNTQTETGAVIGTPSYMSPEQARGFAVDDGTDIWSFGVVLYEMIAHRTPFARPTRTDTLVAILEREPPPLSQFVTDASTELTQLQQIINRALRKVRTERYRTVDEMLADLNGIKHGFELMPRLSERPVDTPQISPIVHHDRNDSNGSGSSPLAVDASSSAASISHHGSAPQRWRPVFTILMLSALLLVAISGTLLYKRYALTQSPSAPASTPGTAAPARLYSQMNTAEQLSFIKEQEQRVSAIMGDRPVKLNDEALNAIKERLDQYVARVGSTSEEPGKEDLRTIYARAVPYIPLITRSFAARKVPVIIGIYLPMIESEYKTCFENEAGAKGLFQFLPQTARVYGVAKEEMCDVEKMTPAAAHYIADRMAELGDDSQSMTLVLLSYNFGAEGVRDALRELRDTENFERNFWTLFANRNRLDEHFRNESAKYVPSFFAASIIGENPQAFGLQTPPLSTVVATGSN